jgi:sporulation protein YlmC with PRC-barrel domain
MTLRTGASLVALSIALGFSPAALAQTQPAPQAPRATEAPKTPVSGQILKQDGDTILAKDLIGATVYAPDKAKIGSISDLILSKDGKNVQGFVLGVGGFLGIGEKSVALQMERLQMSHDQNGLHLVVNANKDELSNAPSFKSAKDMDAERRAAQRPTQSAPGQPTRPATRP